MKRIISSIIASFVLVAGLMAQKNPSQTRFLHFSIADGLPSNGVRSVASDADGFVWIGTFNGLARWDGQRVANFKSLSPHSTLPDDDLKLLFADSHGFLWAKYLKSPGLYQINLFTYEVEHFGQDFYKSSEKFPPNAFEDASGNIWFATQKGLSRYRWEAKTLEFFPLTVDGKNDVTVQACQTPDGRIWVGTGLGLFLFHPENKQYEQIRLFNDDADVHVLASDADGHLWIGRWYNEHGVLEYDPVQRKVLREFNKIKSGSGGFLSTEISRIYVDGGLVWFCCNEGGLCVWDKQQNVLRRFEPDERDPGSLSTWSAMCAIRDKFGNFWTGTESGLDMMLAAEKSPQMLSHNPYFAGSLVYKKTNTAAALSNGNLVFGTDRGLSIFDPRQHTWRNAQLPMYYGSSYNNVVVSLAEHDASSFWAGTWEGLYLLDNRTGSVLREYRVSENPQLIGLNVPHKMMTDSRGDLWFCYNNSPARRWREGNFARLDTLSADGNDLNDRVNCFAEYDKRAVLIGTSDGLARFDHDKQAFHHLPLNCPGEKPPIKVTSLCVSKNGLLYLVANDRVFSLDVAKGAAEAVPLTFSFPLKTCLDLFEDDRGDLWVCTESGLARYNTTRKESFFFDSRNFLQGNTFYSVWRFNHCAKGQDGRLYFAGIAGISVLNPEALAANSPPPVAKITGLKINNQTAAFSASIHKLSEVSLAHWQNNLTIELSAPGSPLPQLNRYAYRLVKVRFWGSEGEKEWNQIGEQHTVNFSNLSPGRYRLEVRAANNDGVWCDEPASLYIRVRPPWYGSWWAYLLYVLVLGGGAYAFYRYQLRTKLEHAENQRLKELDSFKSRFFTNITHEFRTPLTVILGMTDQVKKYFSSRDEQGHSKSVDLIRRNGQNLLNLINQILDLAKLESGKLQLNLEKTDVIAFTKYIVESFHSYASGQKVQLHFLAETDALEMDFDGEKMQAILSNLLSNAIKFTPENGHVYIHIGQTMENGQPFCQIKVRDTGIGIPEEKLGQIFDRFYQVDNSVSRSGEGTGIGLALTKELVRLMRGEVSVSSKKDVGAIFVVTIPITTHSQLAERTTSVASIPLPNNKLQRPTPAFDNLEKPLLLVVEDNEDVREYLIDCVKEQYQVVEAHNGQVGIEKAIELIPDLIISDVMMPEKDGFELCQTVKNDERTSHIPLVLLTAKTDVASRIEGLTRGADDYIAKPFDRKELEIRLHNLVENRRRLQSRYASLPLPPASEDPDLKLEDAFLLKIRNVVEAHLSDSDFEMPQLERALGMSRSQIFRKVKALTDQSPTLFIRSIRLHKAKELLQSSKLTVAEIAYEVGFTTPSYFSTAFLEEFGKNPSDFR